MENQLLQKLYIAYQKEIAMLLKLTPENVRVLAIKDWSYLKANF